MSKITIFSPVEKWENSFKSSRQQHCKCFCRSRVEQCLGCPDVGRSVGELEEGILLLELVRSTVMYLRIKNKRLSRPWKLLAHRNIMVSLS